jgi:hypothetical protein
MVRGAESAPAPEPQAGARSLRETASSCRACPQEKERRKVPSVEGAQLSAEHGRGGPGAQSGRVVDAIAASERGVDEGERLHARVGGAGGGAEMHVLVDELLEAQSLGEGGGQQQAGVGHGVTIRADD